MQKTASAFYAKSYALVVGIGKYENKDLKRTWPDLLNAENDAHSVETLLKKSCFEVTALYGSSATKKAIEEAFDDIGNKVQPLDRVLFYFAGHGFTVPDADGNDKGYIVPFDATDKHSSYIDNRADFGKYSDLMKKAKHQLFILDSCYGGSLGEDSGPSPDSPKDLDTLTGRTVREVLTAGKKNQKVEDGAAVTPGHSLFTGRLLEALQGAAEAHTHHPGFITFSELKDYVEKKASTPGQQPHAGALPGHDRARDFVFVTPPANSIQISKEFELGDTSLAPSEMFHKWGPNRLMDALVKLKESQRIWNVAFELSGSTVASRGNQTDSGARRSAQDLSDYVLEVKYSPLAKEKLRVTVTFHENPAKPKLPKKLPLEIDMNSMDLQLLAERILGSFVPKADFSLHLKQFDCPGCPQDINEKARGAIDNWLADFGPPRVTSANEVDSGSGGGVDFEMYAMLEARFDDTAKSESKKQVIRANIYLEATKSAKTCGPFQTSYVDKDKWEDVLKEAQVGAKDCLASLGK